MNLKKVPKLVNENTFAVLSYVAPKKPWTPGQIFNIILCSILLSVPFIMYYFYKNKKTASQKKKEIIKFVKYVNKTIK